MRKDSKTYNFLIIEDNLGDYVLIEEYLSEYILDPHTTHVVTFEKAQENLKNNGEFDLIFLDLSLPDHSGEDLIKDIISLAKGIPVIALTGFSDLEFSIRSLSLGISDYLLKDELTPPFLYKSVIYAIERNRYIEDLQDSQKRYSELFHLNPSPMWVYEENTLAFLDVNEAAITKYGYTEKEFKQMTMEDLLEKGQLQKLEEITNGEKREKVVYSNLFRHLTKSGTILDVEIESAPILFHDRKAKMVVANDITDKIRHIQTIEQQNKTFKEIAWIQSHVVRAPLARMMGLINLLESTEMEVSAENKQILDFIQKSAEELDEIIRDISKKSENIVYADEK
ncbi:PAS domain S-box protein [Algoriphagus sp.]|uniref:PAS domain S-box protein n=1 Tax=Algoriphagus sp. TaxID=1872435 RepID=UPI002638D7E5|nr:PAS domain S-box protein [Algoriphagus sp.]